MGKNKDAIIIILVIFVLLGLSWDSIKTKDSDGSLLSNSGTSSFDSYPEENTEQNGVVSDSQTQIREIERKAAEIQRQAEEEAAKKNQSKYYGKINLSNISYLNSPDPSQEYITLYPNLSQNEKINITGWRLKSERTGNWVTIGKASTLPFPFSAQNDDVIVGARDNIYLIKGFSPIGISFRSNRCSGYLAENRAFYPYLSRSCPLAKDEPLPQFSTNLDRDDECREMVERVPTCTTPGSYINFSRLPDTVTQSCKDYLQTQVNYNTCVANHFADSDFPGHEWYIYFKVFGPLWRDKHEKINLYDNLGMIVSSISY